MGSVVKHRSQRRLRRGVVRALLCLLVLLLLAAATARRMTSERTPPLVIQRTLAAYVRLAGPPPVLAWPREGQAAAEVEGIGSFGTSGGFAPEPIASVAKVMTAYLTLRAHPLAAGAQGFTMTVTAADVEEQEQRAALGESTVAVRAGERIDERQALQALLLPSANNIAAMLAVYDAGSQGAFVARMNAAARRLGMRASTYTDPSGFADTTVSTAADQLKLARVAMREPAFAAIVDESSAELPVAGRVGNYNGLLGHGGYVGIKTGSDRAAGGCLVFAKRVAIGGQRLLVLGVVLGQREGSLIPAALASARRLGDSVAAALRVRTALPAGARVLTATSVNARQTSVVTTGAVREVGWAGLRLPVRVSLRPAVHRLTRLSAGESLARVTVLGDDDAAGGDAQADAPTTEAVARSSLAGPSLGWRLRHLI
jgi:D-alanyl-D-alanine carboxypeptidase (penicillin-binding protein 5/6)